MSHKTLRPIVKWAGNHASISNIVTSCLPNSCKNYWEPFLGNAAVALRIYNYDNFIEKMYLSDPNRDLIDFYKTLRDASPQFIDNIKGLAAEFNKAVDLNAAFANLRNHFNTLPSGEERSLFFYILNQTCYNGMMRYNKKNLLNSSFSGRKCEIYEDSLKAFANFLRDERVSLFRANYDELDPEPQDVVFLGPPDSYRWYADNRQRLQGLWEAWSSKTVFLMLTGKDEKLLQDMFSGWYFMAIGKRLAVLNY